MAGRRVDQTLEAGKLTAGLVVKKDTNLVFRRGSSHKVATRLENGG
jgi:hypothetical protein